MLMRRVAVHMQHLNTMFSKPQRKNLYKQLANDISKISIDNLKWICLHCPNINYKSLALDEIIKRLTTVDLTINTTNAVDTSTQTNANNDNNIAQPLTCEFVYVVYINNNFVIHMNGVEQSIITSNNTRNYLLAVLKAVKTYGPKYKYYIADKYICDIFYTYIHKWLYNNYRTKDGSPVINQDVIRELYLAGLTNNNVILFENN